MSAGGSAMLAAILIALGVARVRRVLDDPEHPQRAIAPAARSGRSSGSGIALMVLFFVTWIAHGISEWQTYTDEQRAHGEPTSAGDFVAEFSQSTLENWQSEFLQLFAFVSLAALYMHKGSAESKDSDEKVEASLRRIEEHLGTLPASPSDRDARPELPAPDEPPTRIRSARVDRV